MMRREGWQAVVLTAGLVCGVTAISGCSSNAPPPAVGKSLEGIKSPPRGASTVETKVEAVDRFAAQKKAKAEKAAAAKAAKAAKK